MAHDGFTRKDLKRVILGKDIGCRVQPCSVFPLRLLHALNHVSRASQKPWSALTSTAMCLFISFFLCFLDCGWEVGTGIHFGAVRT